MITASKHETLVRFASTTLKSTTFCLKLTNLGAFRVQFLQATFTRESHVSVKINILVPNIIEQFL